MFLIRESRFIYKAHRYTIRIIMTSLADKNTMFFAFATPNS